MGRSVAVYWFRLERIFQSIKLATTNVASAPRFRLERIFQSIKLEHVVLLCDVWFRLERIFQSIKLAAELVCQ